MQISPTGWIARFDGRSDQITQLLVETWDEDANAMVVDTERGCLSAARTMSGFAGLEQVSRVITAVPAQPGWKMRLQEHDANDDLQGDQPVAAWLVTDRGALIPVGGGGIRSTLEPYLNQQIAISPYEGPFDPPPTAVVWDG